MNTRDSRGISLQDADSTNDVTPLSPLNQPPNGSNPSLSKSLDSRAHDEYFDPAELLESISYSLYSYAAMVAPVTAAMVLSRYVK